MQENTILDSIERRIPPRLAIVMPCYNEEAVLKDSVLKLTSIVQDLVAQNLISSESIILCVNDGSRDTTWDIIKSCHQTDKTVCGVNLAGNVGHQNALIAGLSVAAEISDASVTIDADLQDDPSVIREMVAKYLEGADIIYGVRNDRSSDTWFKRTTATTFYRMMKRMGVKTVYNHADFRLLSLRAMKQLLQYQERNLYIRGLVPLIGYRTEKVFYERAERAAGESKYPLAKMLSLAFDGITSFSVKPIHLVVHTGVTFIFVALGILIWVIYEHSVGHTVPGWSSLMLSLWFCSGCMLTGLGIVGEYIGKIYTEVKQRPRFNIEEKLI